MSDLNESAMSETVSTGLPVRTPNGVTHIVSTQGAGPDGTEHFHFYCGAAMPVELNDLTKTVGKFVCVVCQAHFLTATEDLE